jgi:bacterioferritin (cytochrome b1)
VSHENKKDPMDVEGVVDALNAALRLQYRSALAYAVAAGSLVGLRFVPLSPQLAAFAREELEDARRLVEKIVTLGGVPAVDPAEVRCHADGADALAWLLDIEEEAVEALQDCIPLTGQEGRSEALEHRLEHMIMRKQEQRDTVARAARES